MKSAHEMPFGAEIRPDGTRFALWAPSAKSVALELDGTTPQKMPIESDGWAAITVPAIPPGTRYRYRVNGDIAVPDPASRSQPDGLFGASQVVDPTAFEWADEAWQGRPWHEVVLYEVHVGTATPEGTFAALADKLEDLRDLGVTAIELMPLSDCPGERNWGYDGVLHYAPNAAYGTPDDLKRLVDKAHGLGLMMFLDVVYNHFGPSGNYLSSYAHEFFTDKHKTPWGAGLNFDDGEARHVARAYFVNNALYWLDEYHFDGLRFDAVHAIMDDSEEHILTELATRVRKAHPDRAIHLVLENASNETDWLDRDAGGQSKLYDAQWADDSHHSWHVLLTGETDGYYEDYATDPVASLGRALAEGFTFQGQISHHEGDVPRGKPSAHLPPTAFVTFLQNHDQIGNRALGERIHRIADPRRLAMAYAVLLLGPEIPLLFMGEDWAASSPFLYFVDFADDPALSDAIREGRKREFSKFKAFSGTEVPDPTSPETFRRSTLDWAERQGGPHAEMRQHVRALLHLRRSAIMPLLASPYRGSQHTTAPSGAIDITWRFEAGTLRMAAQMGDAGRSVSIGPGRVLWATSDVTVENDVAHLTPWSVVFTQEPHA